MRYDEYTICWVRVCVYAKSEYTCEDKSTSARETIEFGFSGIKMWYLLQQTHQKVSNTWVLIQSCKIWWTDFYSDLIGRMCEWWKTALRFSLQGITFNPNFVFTSCTYHQNQMESMHCLNSSAYRRKFGTLIKYLKLYRHMKTANHSAADCSVHMIFVTSLKAAINKKWTRIDNFGLFADFLRSSNDGGTS